MREREELRQALVIALEQACEAFDHAETKDDHMLCEMRYRTIETALSRLDDPAQGALMRAALERSVIAIDDWLQTYAAELCDPERVKEASKRIGEYGTLSYIADVQEQNRRALSTPSTDTAQTPLNASLFDAMQTELTEGHLALDRLGSPREAEQGDFIHEYLIAERIQNIPAETPGDRNKLVEYYDGEIARITGLYFDALNEIKALKAPAQASGEPVAWLYETWIGEDCWSQKYTDAKPAGNKWERNIRPLYLSPPAPAQRFPIQADIKQIISEGWRNGKSSAEVAAEILREFDMPAQGALGARDNERGSAE